MTFDVVAFPENENEMEEFRFRFHGETLTLEFIRFRRYRRACEASPWETLGEWLYPDLFHNNTLPQPEVPAWATLDAKTYINQQIKFK